MEIDTYSSQRMLQTTCSKPPLCMCKDSNVFKNNTQKLCPWVGDGGDHEEHQSTLLKQVQKVSDATISNCSFLKLYTILIVYFDRASAKLNFGYLGNINQFHFLSIPIPPQFNSAN